MEAEQTLLVVPGWRLDPYDVDFPDYTPKPDIAARVASAQAMGFRVMLYVNILACLRTIRRLRPWSHIRGSSLYARSGVLGVYGRLGAHQVRADQSGFRRVAGTVRRQDG